jgi:imidazolonepropionase-like amidohydrolase
MMIIRSARILDGRGGVIERGTLIVEGGRIVQVGPEGDVRLPRGGDRKGPDLLDLNARGMTVLPGLIDCHVHLCLGAEPDVARAIQEEDPATTLLKATRSARLTLEAGFTTVRDVGYRDHSIFALKRAIEAGQLSGPRLVAAGQVICMTGGHARFIGREADGPAEITKAVREQLVAGADVIKVIASGGVLTPGTSPDSAQLTVEELAAAVAEARLAGRRVAAHAHGAEGMKNAIRARVHSIEHATLMDDEAAGLMRTHGVYMVPTLSALATTADCGPACGVPESAVAKARAMRARHEASFKRAHREGIPIAMGTDAGTPFNQHGENAQELERMVAFGMTPMEAVVAATGAAARLLGLEEVGTLETGKLADFLIVKGDPLQKIGILRDRKQLVAVVQAGRLVAGALRRQV